MGNKHLRGSAKEITAKEKIGRFYDAPEDVTVDDIRRLSRDWTPSSYQRWMESLKIETLEQGVKYVQS